MNTKTIFGRKNTHEEKKTRGFTLIELLVVVAIISLLMAILLPSLSKAREQARAVVCGSHLKSIGQSCYIYAGNIDGYIPTIDQYTMPVAADRKQYGTWNWELIKVLYPSDASIQYPYKALGTNVAAAVVSPQYAIFKCPSITMRYGVNLTRTTPYYGLAFDLGTYSEDGKKYRNATKLSSYETPGKTAFMWDMASNWCSLSKNMHWVEGSLTDWATRVSDSGSSTFTQIHNGKANVLFVDGHVERLSYLELNGNDTMTNIFNNTAISNKDGTWTRTLP